MAAPVPASAARLALHNPALRFGLVAAAWTVVFLGLLRLRVVQTLVVLPFTQLQGHIAAWHLGLEQLPVVVGLECSGTDVLALALAVTLAYPVAWRARLAGALFAILWLSGLNIVRLASLGLAVGSSAFVPLHLQIWPAILMIGALAYLSGWIWVVDRRAMRAGGSLTSTLVRFGVWSTGLVVAFQALSPWLLESRVMVAVSRWSAAAAGAVLEVLGASVNVAGPVINSSHGAYLVTPACITTPLMPIYLAAVMALSLPTAHRVAALLAFGPLFGALVIGRLLTVALPPLVGTSNLILTHAFHQLVLAAIVVGAAAWYGRTDRAWRRVVARAIGAAAFGLMVGVIGGRLYTELIEVAVGAIAAVAPHALTVGGSPADLQGAWFLLPVFHLGLSIALLAALPGPVRVGRWLLAIVLTWAGTLGALVVAGELEAHARLVVPTIVVRGWAVIGPVLAIAVALWFTGRMRRAATSYAEFWHDVGNRFPDLGGAASTAYYRANEERLLTEHLPALSQSRLLKTDLWDEAKNTRILAWAQAQGATVYGVDISAPVVRRALDEFGRRPLAAPVADVRHLPFPDAAFDAVYSMGTIEHFDESEQALCEIARVLKPGGRAIVGVPNRYDPFLRPLLVQGLSLAGAYGYGYEKSFSRRALRDMMERAGFEVEAETAILFVPGWLRMLDLVCYCWCKPLAPVTALALKPFVWLDRHVPAVRRHGYLLASVGIRR